MNVDDLDELLDETQDWILLGLVARGYPVVDVAPNVERIKDRLREQYANAPTPDKNLIPLLRDTFVVQVFADGLRLPARMVFNILATRGHLNPRQAIYLWLGLLLDQSYRPEGLWQMYADYRAIGEGDPLTLPQFIIDVFGNIERDDLDEIEDRILDFCENERALANHWLSAAGEAPIDEKDIPRLIGWIIATKYDGNNRGCAARNIDTLRNDAENNLRRGYNTLSYKLLEDIYDTIDKA